MQIDDRLIINNVAVHLKREIIYNRKYSFIVMASHPAARLGMSARLSFKPAPLMRKSR